MNLLESVNLGIAAFNRATQDKLKRRTILVLSVLDVTPRAEVVKAMSEADPGGKKPSESTLRRMIARTTRQMGMAAFPTNKGGRPSFEVCDQYKREHCAKWIAANGGMPREEQLADPNWDLRPYPPLSSPGTVTPTPSASKIPSPPKTEESPARENVPPSVLTGTPGLEPASTVKPMSREERQKHHQKITAGLARDETGAITTETSATDLSKIKVPHAG